MQELMQTAYRLSWMGDLFSWYHSWYWLMYTLALYYCTKSNIWVKASTMRMRNPARAQKREKTSTTARKGKRMSTRAGRRRSSSTCTTCCNQCFELTGSPAVRDRCLHAAARMHSSLGQDVGQGSAACGRARQPAGGEDNMHPTCGWLNVHLAPAHGKWRHLHASDRISITPTNNYYKMPARTSPGWIHVHYHDTIIIFIRSVHLWIVQTLNKWSMKIHAVTLSVLLPSNRNSFSKSQQHLKSAVQLVAETLRDHDELLPQSRIRWGKEGRLGASAAENRRDHGRVPYLVWIDRSIHGS